MLVITEVDKALVSLLATYTYSTERLQVDLDPLNKDWSAGGPAKCSASSSMTFARIQRSPRRGLVVSIGPQELTLMCT